MRELLWITTLAAMATLIYCAVPQPHPPGAAPTHEAPATAVAPLSPPKAVVPPKAHAARGGHGEPDRSSGPAAAPPASEETASSPPASASPASRDAPAESTAGPNGQADLAASAALDLDGLEQRLRDTHAIGLLAKLSLKNQVNALLDEFRGFHDGHVDVPLAELRHRYEDLLLKVISLLRDSDEPLARAVASSREAIWDILADPNTFTDIRATRAPTQSGTPTATARPRTRTAIATTVS